ncbi:tyrosine protein kinase [Mycolicibacterium neoaurum]|uniref:tyrosine protein kinase n=1 Tax=Mycolicibacterium neoaurum TaxID=1795 RepID=UPI0030152FB5
MAFQIHPADTDMLLPLPGREQWDPHLIHTHYFGFSVPEAEIGAFLYVRYMPTFPLSQGGVCVFQGMDNIEYTDMAYLDYEITMPWPVVDGNTVTTANGLSIEFLELGKSVRLRYTAEDGKMSFDVRQDAVTPLLARGHVMPGEEHHRDVAREPGGSEQFMRVTGELVLDGTTYEVNCFAPRDRSWRQVRVEKRGAVPVPPVGWSPMYFGEDLIFNQISFEPLDTGPRWAGLYDVGDRPSHHFAWVQRGEESRSVVSVRRNVLEYHPRLHMATQQEITAVDDRGDTYRFRGAAIAAAAVPAWPNVAFRDSVYRWEDDQGRIAHSTYQEIWFDRYQQAMSRRTRAVLNP